MNDLNQFIKVMAVMMGKCAHDWHGFSSGMTCTKCGYRVPYHTDPPKLRKSSNMKRLFLH